MNFRGFFGWSRISRVTIIKLRSRLFEHNDSVLKFKYHKYFEMVCVLYNLASTFSPLSTDFWRTTVLSSIQLSQSLRVIVLSASSKKFFQLFQTVAIFSLEINQTNCLSLLKTLQFNYLKVSADKIRLFIEQPSLAFLNELALKKCKRKINFVIFSTLENIFLRSQAQTVASLKINCATLRLY